jgi:hypothetical protein
MSTLQEIRAAADGLSAEERSALVTWLSQSKDVLDLRREQLRRELQVGLDEIERGEVALLDMQEIKRQARAEFDAMRPR